MPFGYRRAQRIVTPAQAGVHVWRCGESLDSRLRGNDGPNIPCEGAGPTKTALYGLVVGAALAANGCTAMFWAFRLFAGKPAPTETALCGLVVGAALAANGRTAMFWAFRLFAGEMILAEPRAVNGVKAGLAASR